MSLRRYIVFSLTLAIVLFVGVSDAFAQLNFGDSSDFLRNANEGRTGLTANGIENQAGVIITVALQLVGVAFFFLMVYGGFLWMTDRGNEQQVDQARNTIIAAVIGLLVVLGAYAATNFVVDRFIDPIAGSNTTQDLPAEVQQEQQQQNLQQNNAIPTPRAGQIGGICRLDADCSGSGGVCVNLRCVQRGAVCQFNNQCLEDGVCENGICVYP